MWKNPLLYKSLDMKRARYLVVDGSFSYLPLADESREVIFKMPIALGWRKDFYFLLPVRDAPKKNAVLIWEFSKPGLTPPFPPQGILELLGHFSVGKFFFETFGHFLCHISPKNKEKSAQQF